jgi:hypothetical protein
MPLGVLGIAIARRRAVSDQRRWRLLVVLLIACIALRSRRMISFTEWSELMLELPVYGFALTVLLTGAERQVARMICLACGALVAVGLYAHWRIGRGVGSLRGAFPPFETARGTIRVAPGLARELSYVRTAAEQVDPNGRRPLFAFVYSGAFSYFVGRPAVGSLTHGFRISLYPSPDSAYRAVVAARSRPILVDRPVKPRWVQSTEFAPWRWEARMVEDHYSRVDRPLFEKLKVGCARVEVPERESKGFILFDCPAADDK